MSNNEQREKDINDEKGVNSNERENDSEQMEADSEEVNMIGIRYNNNDH